MADPGKREKILILGGTREAARLASVLVDAGHDVTTSLAGRTREPKPVAGKLRMGGFSGNGMSGAEGLAAYLLSERFDRLIDATHPFASRISHNAREAAALCNIAFEQRQREPWQRQEGDAWIEVGSVEGAVVAIPAGARVLLAIGSQHIAPFAWRSDVHFTVRVVDPPQAGLTLPDHDLILGRPPGDTESELQLLRSRAITHIVCRNSGGSGAYAKIEAARRLGLPVIMIGRP